MKRKKGLRKRKKQGLVGRSVSTSTSPKKSSHCGKGCFAIVPVIQEWSSDDDSGFTLVYKLKFSQNVAAKNKKKAAGLRPPSGKRLPLEVEPELRCQSPRRHVVGAAESGEEVVECVFVGYVDGRQLQAHFIFISVEQVVVSDGDIKKTSTRNARRILVVVLGVWFRHIQQGRSVLRERTRIRERNRRRRTYRSAA